MTDKKYPGLRFISFGFVVAIFVTFAMCGVMIRAEIDRISKRSTAPANTAGVVYAQASPPRRYPSSVEAAEQTPPAQAPKPGNEAPRFNPADPSYGRFRVLQGQWHVKGLDEKGVWVLNIEIRENPATPGEFFAYTTFTNFPMKPAIPDLSKGAIDALVMMRNMTPHSMILAGTLSHGAISFQVKKIIGTPECPLTSLVVTLFGDNGLMVEWQYGSCRSGSGLLLRGGA